MKLLWTMIVSSYDNHCSIDRSFLTIMKHRFELVTSLVCMKIKSPPKNIYTFEMNLHLDLIDKPYNPLVNSGAISSTALLLNHAGRNDNSSEEMSTTYELVHGCIKVKITIN